ncbi:MAG: histidine phosphatase family protein [Patescibacteria group bacterium]
MQRTIFLVRHCEYANPRRVVPGRLPFPLSAVGRKRAKRLAEFFADKQITKIYSSAVLRAQQTADQISGGKIPVVNDARLLETFSAYQGTPSRSQKQDRLDYYTHTKELGGETYLDIQRRIVLFFDEIRRKKEGNVIVVSHGDPVNFLFVFLHHGKLPPVSRELWDKVNASYQSKGSIRPLELVGGKVIIRPMVVV